MRHALIAVAALGLLPLAALADEEPASSAALTASSVFFAGRLMGEE